MQALVGAGRRGSDARPPDTEGPPACLFPQGSSQVLPPRSAPPPQLSKPEPGQGVQLGYLRAPPLGSPTAWDRLAPQAPQEVADVEQMLVDAVIQTAGF